jgi:hypothetical protein
MALLSIQPPTEISTSNIFCGAKAVSVPQVMKSGNLDLLEHSGSIQASTGIVSHF